MITSIADGVRLCDSVSSEAVRMLADFYHMALSGERAEEVARAVRRCATFISRVRWGADCRYPATARTTRRSSARSAPSGTTAT